METEEKKYKKKSIKKNYIYNLIYNVVSLLTPLVVTPFVARVLGSSGVGQYAFTYSLITYFVLFASFGFGFYAQREIAKYQGNKHQQSVVFFEIVLARLCFVIASLLVHITLIIAGIYKETYAILMWILTLNIVAVGFDITFLFQGNEEFGLIALRDSVIRIIGVVLVICLVRKESHVWIYTMCQSLTLIVSSLSLWTRLPKILCKIPINELNLKKHFLPAFRLFIPTVAVSIYTVLDRTLIGALVPGTTIINGVEKSLADVENGFYDQSEKIVKMALIIITSLGTVMIPRNSNAIEKGNIEEFKSNVNIALNFVLFLGLPLTFGLAAIARNFAPWFFGDGYDKVPKLIMLLSPIILIIGFSNVLGLQYLIPQKRDSKYTIAIISGALINLVLNLCLIKNFLAEGAAVATLCAESVVTIIMFIFARKDINFFKLIICAWKYIISGAIMFVAVYFSQYYLEPSLFHTLLLVLEGIVIYLVLLIILRDKLLFLVFRKLKNRFLRKEKELDEKQ